MSDATTNKQAHSLLSYYEKLYVAKYGSKPKFNRYTAKWGMVDVLDSVGYDRSKELLDYYFRTDSNHNVTGFFYAYDQLDENERDQRADRERRRKVLAATKERVKEWSSEHRSTGNFGSMQE